ncbi:MAG: hypothetical protein HY930_01475 [Euryarchaeota archaeon]|nr:hypothetical protein [Euryarchaeota archaeon]
MNIVITLLILLSIVPIYILIKIWLYERSGGKGEFRVPPKVIYAYIAILVAVIIAMLLGPMLH